MLGNNQNIQHHATHIFVSVSLLGILYGIVHNVRFTQCQFSLAKIATRFHIISQMTYNINSFLFESIRQKRPNELEYV